MFYHVSHEDVSVVWGKCAVRPHKCCIHGQSGVQSQKGTQIYASIESQKVTLINGRS